MHIRFGFARASLRSDALNLMPGSAAERLLRRSLVLQPSLLVEARVAIAVYNQKRYAEAISLFEAVLPRVGLNSELADAYSFSLERVGRLAESLAVREQVHRRAPTAARAIQLVAGMMRAGRHDVLAKLIPALLARYPDDPELLVAGSAWALAADHPQTVGGAHGPDRQAPIGRQCVTRFTKPGENRFFFQNHLAFSCQRLVVYTYPVC